MLKCSLLEKVGFLFIELESSDFSEIERDMKRFMARASGEVVDAGLYAAAKVVAADAKANASFKDRSGGLRASIRARKRTARDHVMVRAGGPDAWQAHIIEAGSVRAPAFPFLRPALYNSQAAQFAAAIAEMRRLVSSLKR